MSVRASQSVRVLSRAAKPGGLGHQAVVDFYDCATGRLDDIDWVRDTLIRAALAANATIVQTCFHKFSPWGISGVLVIAESHIAVHIWPENRYAAIDMFTCGTSVDYDRAVRELAVAFGAKRQVMRTFTRGEEL